MSRVHRSVMHALVFLIFIGAISMGIGQPSTPEDEYRSLLALSKESPPNAMRDNRDATLNWAHARFIHLHERGLEFLRAHPAHPLRWDVLVLLQYGRDFKINTLPDGSRQLVPDLEGRRKWETKYYGMLEELLAARDASTGARYEGLVQLIQHTSRSVHRGAAESDQAAIVRTRTWIEAFQQEFPRSGALPSLYNTVAVMLDAIDPAQCAEFLRQVKARHVSDEFPDPEVRKKIAGRLRVLEGQAEPVESLWAQLRQFDPTLGDMSRYHGKVVLIAMLPVSWDGYTERLKQLYSKHNDAGFEIVQVAYRNSSTSAPPEQREKVAMEAYVAGKGWPWRVVWDPNGHLGGFAGTWGQNTIPAYLVIGRDGRILNDRGGAFDYAAQIARELGRTGAP